LNCPKCSAESSCAKFAKTASRRASLFEQELGAATLAPTMRKPFGFLAEGLLSE
jgi:hypothetical protein